MIAYWIYVDAPNNLSIEIFERIRINRLSEDIPYVITKIYGVAGSECEIQGNKEWVVYKNASYAEITIPIIKEPRDPGFISGFSSSSAIIATIIGFAFSMVRRKERSHQQRR